MSQLIPFEFQSHDVRVLIHDSGDPWWVARDVCDALGYSNPRDVLQRLDDDEKGVASIDTPGGMQSVSIVNESGLYNLVLGSKKSEAKTFKRWITHEVIPAVRKTGAYGSPLTAVPSLPSADAQLATIEKALDILTRLGQLTSRDALMYADATRNASLPGQGLIAAPVAHGFSVAERVTHLGYTLTRNQQATFVPILGKMLAKEYRSRYGTDPHKESRYVDGATRLVAWYAEDEGEWIDAMIQGYMAGFPGLQTVVQP